MRPCNTVLFFFLAPGTMGFVVPWVITGWQQPEGELGALELLGAGLVACGLVAVVACFRRFVREGREPPPPWRRPSPWWSAGCTATSATRCTSPSPR